MEHESAVGEVVGDLRARPLTLSAAVAILAERERELLELKGSCSNIKCHLHYAHSGSCGDRK